jgi:hypothetical protein
MLYGLCRKAPNWCLAAFRWIPSIAAETVVKTTMTRDTVAAKELFDWLRMRQDEMAGMLAELIAVPTENPPGKTYGACADLLQARLSDHGLECTRFQSPDDPRNSEQGTLEARFTSTGITMLFPRNRPTSFGLREKIISCLAAAPAT